MKRIYLDYAATTPADPRVIRAMLPYLNKKFGNTMSLHNFGQEAKSALEESREVVAGLMGAKANEIIFTGSATESNNLTLKGIAFANKKRGRHIIISRVEHPCIMESAKWLESQGFEITRLKVDKYGFVNPKDVKKAIKKGTILVSVIHASNEIGTIQPIVKIGKICKESGVYFHTDAVQSFGKIPIDVDKMNIDLLSASSHKMYGPKGAACLYIREGTKIEPILHGGGQEQGFRSSTVNVPAIIGFAKAVEIAEKEMRKEAERLTKLRNKLIKGVLGKIPGSHLSGHPQKRLPNNANFWFENVEGESIIIQLDLSGMAASTGSACSSAKLEPSHVLLAIGLKHEEAHGSLRLSLGKWTKASEINYILKVLPGIIKKLREISGTKQF
ncbi:MAG: cysteine desulfurase NifS [Candidatus Nealsonbacteria bacterium CG_4_10_14_0_2_um_filter_40_15]|uniref:Cysteine desulfurase IscS n=2 Tax=Candidatus Nealsoniibacteriota TaxID=1817911 RepID=A0A2M7D7C4_9BACT|nr:MAG: cysteine desulfurase NifS [Candidatus Nealsonbacteria bacterium CG02_land_8_20_14_3_00_40_11]PIZ87820.1 MAG: cysteine desulfurase NifS [Candidatus Nealsonbacteria bacterium CG_4_10_14_0_2_um_filter_40_15]